LGWPPNPSAALEQPRRSLRRDPDEARALKFLSRFSGYFLAESSRQLGRPTSTNASPEPARLPSPLRILFAAARAVLSVAGGQTAKDDVMQLMTRVVSGLKRRSQGGLMAVARIQDRRIEVIPLRHLQPVGADSFDEAVLLRVLSEVRNGDFSVRMPLDWVGVGGKIADRLNEVIAANQTLGDELAKVSRVVGKEGRLSQRVALRGSDGVWAESIESVNSLIDDLVRPTLEVQRVIGAVASGDLSKKITAEVRGEMLELKNTLNAMVDQLNGFVSEVTRVAREVGTEGKLGQAAAVTIEVGGVWKELTDNVNLMAGNLTGQVRDIAEVTTAVANGDLSKKISADVQGEFLELKNTVNAMVDQLNRFASEVTRVAFEVGVEGKLGGQAQSAEVAGVWKDLTDNVNQLAANLTNQVRAIADVATAVTEGDLTRQVGVQASGEVAVLKDKLNEMIRNLRETTRLNTEQDWLKTNLARFTRMLQGQRDLATVSSMILSELAPLVSAQHGVFYTLASLEDGGEAVLRYQAGYGYQERKALANQFRLGEGLVGQCALEKQRILLTDVPGDYVRITSGLGESVPLNIIVLPILFEGSVRAVVELASFSRFSPTHQAFLDQLTESIGLVLNTIEANTLTETLLKQSQSQAQELQSRQQELRGSYEEASRLAEQNIEVERKRQDVELAKRLVEEEAEQLAISSKYKSEFFSNMSHELRTPLNSLLILAQELKDNPEHNLTETQVQYASVIQSSGSDLLRLLNDILDLAKVESGTVTLDISQLALSELRETIVRDFGHVADQKGVAFSVTLERDLPPSIATDPPRLRQVLNNLLSNAFKFTETGEVSARIRRAKRGWRPEHDELQQARTVIAFEIADTGIGITPQTQRRIFEAFSQANGTTARQYGGTGLGLSISRELVRLLGGEITLTSQPDHGSTFTVYLPSTSTATPPPPPTPTATATPTPTATPPPRASQPATLTDLAGVKALIIDDDIRNIFALSTLLEHGQLDVVSAESGREAIAILKQTPEIEIVLVDIMMPIMDGYATIKAIRELPPYQHIPILAVTANVTPGERARTIEAGASEYIPKPVDPNDLMIVLGQWLPAIAAARRPRLADDRPTAR
jgi:signal transduction histidine kinase/HAMP domain-containing protein/ActR/RegA family two-component response regulator